MSAIAVLYNLDGRHADIPTLTRLSESLRHRGPDQGIFSDKQVGLIHRTFSAKQGSIQESLPAKSHDGNYVITCDARLDNRDELISSLSLRDRQAADITDSELILASFSRWGEGCAAKLAGDFVFAIWDERRERLFAARDQLGVKHFYYYFEPGRIFALASEIKALLQIEGVRRELNEEYVGDFLICSTADKESTFFKRIFRLPATHALSIGVHRFKKWEYWAPNTNEIKLKTAHDYHEAFKEKLGEAVRHRLRSDHPIGSFLSGGLDSSAIVCLASEYLREAKKDPCETFSAVFPSVSRLDPNIDERVYMDSVVKKSGCRANFICVDDEDPLQYMATVFRHADHPVGAPNVYMDCKIFQAAEEKGVRVLLSGTDGDSTVSYGYEDFTELAVRRRYLRLFREAAAMSKNMPGSRHSFKRLAWHRGVKRSVPGLLLRGWRLVRNVPPSAARRPATPFRLNLNAIEPSVRKSLRVEERFEHFCKLSQPAGISPAESHWRALTGGHFAFVLEQLEKISAAFGVEVRYPFFDRNLIEFCINLPPGQRIYGGWTRSIFRHSMEGILPTDIQWRTDKSNIGSSVKVNLLKYGSERIEAMMDDGTSALRRYVDTRVLREAYDRYKREPMTREREALLILTNVYLSNWLKHANFA